MKVYITLFFSILFMVESFAQDLNELSKFTGNHHIPRIIDYAYIDSDWVEGKTDKGSINFGLDCIWFKRDLGKWTFRKIQFADFDELAGTYLFESEHGKIQIEKDFKKIEFFDLEGRSSKLSPIFFLIF